MTTLTVARAAAMPRVNLLPPEIAQAARFRRLKVVLGLVLVAAAVVVGMLFFWANSQVTSAQAELDTAKAEGVQLQAQAAKYAEVPQVYNAVATAAGQLNQAMSMEVRWSFLLNDLSLTIPDNVRLTQMVATEQVDPTATPTTGPVGTPGIATINYSGKATTFDAIASFLQSLAKQKSYADPYFTSATKETDSSTVGPVIDFESSVTVTDKALSHRYGPKAGS